MAHWSVVDDFTAACCRQFEMLTSARNRTTLKWSIIAASSGIKAIIVHFLK